MDQAKLPVRKAQLSRRGETRVPAFQWRDSTGRSWAPSQMRTGHLFHTVSMIWNHVMPADAATHDYRRYRFDPHYTREYMGRAVIEMLPELMRRPDLTSWQSRRLQWMWEYLKKNDVQLKIDSGQRRLER